MRPERAAGLEPNATRHQPSPVRLADRDRRTHQLELVAEEQPVLLGAGCADATVSLGSQGIAGIGAGV
jgi:hypothetical protein